jgi:hypothetical protein
MHNIEILLLLLYVYSVAGCLPVRYLATLWPSTLQYSVFTRTSSLRRVCIHNPHNGRLPTGCVGRYVGRYCSSRTTGRRDAWKAAKQFCRNHVPGNCFFLLCVCNVRFSSQIARAQKHLVFMIAVSGTFHLRLWRCIKSTETDVILVVTEFYV